jgi:V8-like Glu-specific endopeptidase
MDKPPFCYAGRLNVHWSSADQDVHGSAQFVAPGLLLTAAHCVRWSGQWNKNLYFLKRYKNGASDVPIFKIDKIGVLAGWINHTRSNEPSEAAWVFDLAVLKIRGSEKSGHAPLTPLSDDIQSMTSLGYPGDFDKGQTMFYSEGMRTSGKYEGTVGLHPSRMGFGASGGAWVADQGDGARVIGLNSFKMSRDPETDYSPILGDSAVALIASMAALD